MRSHIRRGGQLLSKVQSESPQLAATLRYAHLVEFGPEVLSLRLPLEMLFTPKLLRKSRIVKSKGCALIVFWV